MLSTAANILALMRANFLRRRCSQWNTAVAKTPYSIDVFATFVNRMRGVVACARKAIL
jgi:hypothetical protein